MKKVLLVAAIAGFAMTSCKKITLVLAMYLHQGVTLLQPTRMN